MTAPRTIVHIGADKTGTTAIQRAMAANRAELAERGTWYPDLDGRPDHRSLAGLRSPRPLSVPAGIDTVFLSSEALWPLPAGRIGPLLDRLPDGEVVIVAYVREPSDHADAAFGQRLRLSRTERELRLLLASRHLPPSINPIVTRSLRRLRQLERWVRVVESRAAVGRSAVRPTASLVIRPYWPTGPGSWDVVTDLCRAVGLDAAVPLVAERPDPRPNPTPNLTTIHASVLVRARAGPEAQARFLDALAASGDDRPPGPLLPPGLGRHIRRRARPALARLDELVGGLSALLDDGDRSAGDDGPSPSSLDPAEARALLAGVWPTFPSGGSDP